MLLAVLLAVALALPPDTKVLVLRSGERVNVAGKIEVQGTKALFREARGSFYSIDVAEIDLDATTKAAARTEPTPSGTPVPSKTLAVSPEEKERLLKDLSRSKGRPVPVPSPEAGIAAPSPSPGPEATPDASEEEWRARGKAAREAVEGWKNQLAALQQHEKDMEAFLLRLRGMYRDETLTAQLLDLEQTRHNIGVAKSNLEKAEKQLFDLQEEARRKDILPGWLR